MSLLDDDLVNMETQKSDTQRKKDWTAAEKSFKELEKEIAPFVRRSQLVKRNTRGRWKIAGALTIADGDTLED